MIDFGEGQKLLLRSFIKVERDSDRLGEAIDFDVETDAEPEGGWWTLLPSDDRDFPEVVIQPELIEETEAE